ncbi:Putative transporter, DMT superfamily protein [Pseudooceanicola batsensis HTCC2597]|uniref:Putative transporter, DMT superfamily protein n=1 Tax=Pseudooceanicola batsensis (strain ATCC BAA-863 / DSM 15984 / KCTC 12145 / HTCC2597) TaxID=252305 RepID=A3U3Y0_PSEBH|nr:DMT family transporter [Pseudooceanicola batsensis]EAQ01116.1 Putative transporter, DMT superfamily protein [Pseudooceanicola batsensis HTCC2597]
MDLRAIGLGLAFALMWSSAFTSARMIVADAPPLTALALRFLISGLLGIAVARALGQSWSLTRVQWRSTIVFGLCQNALYLGLFFIAMQRIEASLAAIIASSMPLFVGLAGWVALGDRLRPLAIAGLVLGMGGVALIMGSRLTGGADAGGLVLCIIGTLALTVATLSVRGASSGGNVLMIVGLQMLVGSAALSLAAVTFETWEVTWSARMVLAFIYTTLIPGLAATLTWFVLVNRIGAVRAATFHFLNPFFGVIIAAIVLGEAIGPLDIVGAGIIAAGILAVQLSKQTARA